MNTCFYEKHSECSSFVSDERVGFKYIKAEEGSTLKIEYVKEKHIFFFIEGSVKMRYNEFNNHEFNAGEIVFLPKSADCIAEVLTPCKMIVLAYDCPAKICDKSTLREMLINSPGVRYSFKGTPIKPELMQYLALLRIYLQKGINCRYIHDLKMKELFLLFKFYYTKEELVQLFYPMIGNSIDFRGKIMENYLSVKTVKDLAKICNYSESRFNDLFMAEFNESPYQWIQKQKAKHIKGKLIDADITIKEIVNEFNFTSPSHFHKFCMKYLGGSPAKIRQQIINKTN
ncbi:MAG: AraC family transcriptional regulator [Muribaculaceae bacterium]